MRRKLVGVAKAAELVAEIPVRAVIRILVVSNSRALASVLDQFTGISIQHSPIEAASVRGVLSLNRFTWVLIGEAADERAVARLIQSARRSSPDLRIAMLGPAADVGRCDRWLRRGVECYMAWPIEPQRLVEAVKVATHQDVTVVDRCFQRSLLELCGRLQPTDGLTDREIGILRRVAQGFHNSEIGRMLQLGEHTVEFHVSNIISKLEVRSRAQAVARASLLGLIALEEIQVFEAED